MSQGPYNLAMETSSRHGSVALGRGDELLEAVDLPARRRHAIALMPTIEQLFDRHGLRPADLAELYVSIGPGSFTGLRVGVTTAKLLARMIGCRLVAVPTVDVVAQNAPADRAHVAVLLAARGGRFYAAVYDRREDGWHRRAEPALLSPAELCESAPRPLALLGDEATLRTADEWPEGVECLGPDLAVPRSESVRGIGWRLAREGHQADPMTLTPLYVHRPAPEEKLENR